MNQNEAIERLNAMLAKSGPIRTDQVALWIEMRKQPATAPFDIVAYRRTSPVFPDRPYVVHYVNETGGLHGSYDLTLGQALEEAHDRAGDGHWTIAEHDFSQAIRGAFAP